MDYLIESKRNKADALKLMRKVLKKYGVSPTAMVADILPSHGAALRLLGLSHRRGVAGKKNNRGKIPTRWCDDKSARCSASNRPDQRNDFSLFAPPHAITSTPDVTGSHEGITGFSAWRRWYHGETRRFRREKPSNPFLAYANSINVTMPS